MRCQSIARAESASLGHVGRDMSKCILRRYLVLYRKRNAKSSRDGWMMMMMMMMVVVIMIRSLGRLRTYNANSV